MLYTTFGSFNLETMTSGGCVAYVQLYFKSEDRSWAAARAEGGQGRVQHAAGDVAQLYVRYISEGRHRRLADFDEHLEDLSRDWTNRLLAA